MFTETSVWLYVDRGLSHFRDASTGPTNRIFARIESLLMNSSLSWELIYSQSLLIEKGCEW